MPIDPFHPDAVAPETAALNRGIAEQMRRLPDLWSFPPEQVRESRRKGRGIFPLPPHDPRARVFTVPGPRGPVPVREIAAQNPQGVYLHIHGGGWMLGQADFQDPMLASYADQAGFTALSVDYALAPEHPYPAGPDDCEAVALWLAREGPARYGTDRFAIGGESAGATLSVATLVRLRDRHGLTPFAGANLNAGCYDLGLTPSARAFGEQRLVLDTRDIRQFAAGYLRSGRDARHDLRAPDISPLYADLRHLPPALIAVGTADPLLDDSLFLAARWQAAGNRAELKLWPGGVHVFGTFDLPMAREAAAAEIAFLKGL